MFPAPRSASRKHSECCCLHGVVAVPVRGLTPRICTPRMGFPRRRLFWVTTTTFSSAYRSVPGTINHFLPENFSCPGAGRIPEDFIVFGFAEGLQVSGDILQTGKIQIHINHFSVPCLQRIFRPGTFAIWHRRPGDIQCHSFVGPFQDKKPR